MKELVKKLEQEHAELNNKLVKLRAFVGGEKFKTVVNAVQADLLIMQLHAMEVYSKVLELRIANIWSVIGCQFAGDSEKDDVFPLVRLCSQRSIKSTKANRKK